ncbi:Acyl-phosphate:glycerol-3-phosphate O-acyltransferase PlsY [Acidisarcina polymorpha]|uniref:Glycerol-3-phosphate acyltransferase n=1 Tax=Acidisarcina polymorpha TaxID=2211140 RepID=A0A2Z5G3M0_9BACT|nr:glycerol-3-phosphate 1-O-acyltransferase PlsY [Acidisarcina polymorpha]AXC13712.1 Acyl-phosphate:glycerol-3-phosphate O-acyltransferase PlsY [Acidisarcina polymorpha]
MAFLPYLFVAAVAYLLGSIPFGFLLVLLFRKEDIRTKGSGNIGATNVVRSGAKGLGLLTFFLDAAKGYLAVLAAGWILRWFGGMAAVPQDAAAIAALFAILGHMYPMWLRFKGGKGVATSLGVFLALSPVAAVSGLAIFVVVLLIWRYVSLASIVAALVFPVAAIYVSRASRTSMFEVVIVLVPLLVIVKHRQNLNRLLRGTEYRFGKSREQSAP